MPIECYAQRLLNPFRGTMQVIKFASAEAVSTDGLHWDIYVSNEALRQGLDGPVQVSDIRYGSWSAGRGLKRGPIYPSADFRRMEAMAAVVYEHLLQVRERVPFPLRDRFELWLLDRSGLPFALLESRLEAPQALPETGLVWRPGLAARARFGTDEAAGACADRLAAAVAANAAEAPALQWFERSQDGGGTGLLGLNLVPAWLGRILPAAAFPELLLGRPESPEAGRLVEAFQAWQAVWLLTLPLSQAMRTRLEREARRQVTLVEGLVRLYPEIVDPTVLNAARVEARLLQSQEAASAGEADDMATFYIELNPAGGNYT